MMADVNNIAMVFAPNMTQMVDPLTALMYAVQVMNFLKTVITKTLREQEDRVVDSYGALPLEPYDGNRDQGPMLNLNLQENHDEYEEKEHQFITDDDPLSGYLTASEEYDGPRFFVWPPIEPRTTVINTNEPKPAQTSISDRN